MLMKKAQPVFSKDWVQMKSAMAKLLKYSMGIMNRRLGLRNSPRIQNRRIKKLIWWAKLSSGRENRSRKRIRNFRVWVERAEKQRQLGKIQTDFPLVRKGLSVKTLRAHPAPNKINENRSTLDISNWKSWIPRVNSKQTTRVIVGEKKNSLRRKENYRLVSGLSTALTSEDDGALSPGSDGESRGPRSLHRAVKEQQEELLTRPRNCEM